MKVEHISSDDENIISLIVEDVTAPFVNAIRRIIITEIPVYACKELVVYENTSPLFDESIAHRVGLIPLKTPLDSDESSRMVTISLEATGPTTVYSADMVSDDAEVSPIDGGFPIVKLGPGQKLSFNAECCVGFGKDHARWQPGLASYKNYPIIKIDSKRCNLCGRCSTACPQNILQMTDDAINVVDVMMCTFCKSCMEACTSSNEETLIKVIPQDDKFIFKVESFGNMTAKDLLTTALKMIENKANSLNQQILG